MAGWKESNTWLQARDSVRRLLRQGKYLVGHDPIFLPILLRLTPMGISKQITDLTDIVVEGSRDRAIPSRCSRSRMPRTTGSGLPVTSIIPRR